MSEIVTVGDKIQMTCATSQATIRYTLDGNNPTESSTIYSDPFEITESCTIKARAYRGSMNPSEIASLQAIIAPTEWVGSNLYDAIEMGADTITYGNGKFVAIGDASNDYNVRGAYSEDGINWTRIEDIETIFNSTMDEVRGITYGGGKFIVFGLKGDYTRSIAAYSEDGINWTEIEDLASGTIKSMTYGNGKFVGVTFSTLVYSEDGINWTKIENSTVSNAVIAYGDGKFVAIDDAYIYNSEDGINWNNVGEHGVFGNIRCITYGNGKFVAGATQSTIGVSENGINWSFNKIETGSAVSSAFSAIAYGKGKFVALDNNWFYHAYSEDGINWTRIEDLVIKGSSRVSSNMTYGNGKFVAVTNYKRNTNFTASYCIA